MILSYKVSWNRDEAKLDNLYTAEYRRYLLLNDPFHQQLIKDHALNVFRFKDDPNDLFYLAFNDEVKDDNPQDVIADITKIYEKPDGIWADIEMPEKIVMMISGTYGSAALFNASLVPVVYRYLNHIVKEFAILTFVLEYKGEHIYVPNR